MLKMGGGKWFFGQKSFANRQKGSTFADNCTLSVRARIRMQHTNLGAKKRTET